MARPKTGRPVGRPGAFNDALAEKLAQGLAEGRTISAQVKEPGMPPLGTVARWVTERAEFRDMLTRAREIGTHFLAEEALTIADNVEIDPAHKRLMIETRIRLIGQWNRAVYGPKAPQISVQNTTTTTVATLNVAALDPAARDALEQALTNLEGTTYEQIGYSGSDAAADDDE